MISWSHALMPKVRPAIIFVYSALLTLVMLHFPVAKFWLSLMNSGRLNDLPTSGLQATILIVHVPAVFLLARHEAITRLIRDSWSIKVVLSLLGIAGISTAWSVLPGQTFWDWSVIVSSVLGAVFMGAFLDLERFLLSILVAIQISIFLSIWAVKRNWSSALQPDSVHWQGIFGNRNTLAPVAAMGVLTSISMILLMLIGRQRARPLTRLYSVLLLTACLTSSMYVLIKTKSLTSWAGLSFALILAFITLVATLLNDHRPHRNMSAGFIVWIAGLVSIVVGFVLISIFSGVISSRFARYGKLSGRFDYWKADLNGIIKRPITGWGWNSAWLSEAFRLEVAPRNTPLNWSHSAWLDFGLGMGIAGLILGLAWLVLLLKQASAAAVASPKMIAVLAMDGFAIVVMSMESMSWVFHWFFALIVGGSILAARTLKGEQGRADTRV